VLAYPDCIGKETIKWLFTNVPCTLHAVNVNVLMLIIARLNAFTLLVGWQEGIRPVKNWVVGGWCGYLSGMRCRFEYGLADATATHCLLLQ